MSRWIDVHAHLYDLSKEELEATVDRALKNGVHTIVNTATNLTTADTVLCQCKQYESMYGMVGISPFDCETTLVDSWEKLLTQNAQHPKVIGIGEIGLDDSNPIYPSLNAQKPLFEKQLSIAKDLNVPVALHSRGAESLAVDLLQSHSITHALFHCFTGEKRDLVRLLDAGYFVSYSGIITFKNNPCKELVAYTPLDRLFIETDSPYLAPPPFRGKRNEPAHASIIGDFVAHLKNIPSRQLSEQINSNFESLFNIPMQQ